MTSGKTVRQFIDDVLESLGLVYYDSMNPTDKDRGKIRHRDRAKQLHDFTGLLWGKITPTNIEGYVEFAGKVFFFIEDKFEGAEMPYGQRLAFERLVDVIEQGGAKAYLLLVEHNAPPDRDIDVAKCKVISWRTGGEWVIAEPTSHS